MEVEAMEIEPPNSNSNSNSLQQFGLNISIQTNFAQHYVFQIVPNNDWSAMAVSLSTNALKLYSPHSGQYFGEFIDHNDVVNHISFSGPSPDVLHSCSSDGTIRAWDCRSMKQVSCINAGASREVSSFSFGGAGDNLLVAGCNVEMESRRSVFVCKPQISFWDWRTQRQVACLEDTHSEDVTQVQFVPGHRNKLVSASVDGLMCLFDTSGDININDHLESVYNVGTSVGKIGFFGKTNEKLWCLTQIETLSVWDWKTATNEVTFHDARSQASNNWLLDDVHYFIDCHYSSNDDRLWVIGGTNSGSFGYFPVTYQGSRSIGRSEAIFKGGHAGVVRCVLPMSSLPGTINQSQGIFGWTGGEDGRLCCWRSDVSSNTNHSWISSTLVSKSPKNCRKNRHHPY